VVNTVAIAHPHPRCAAPRPTRVHALVHGYASAARVAATVLLAVVTLHAVV
jgi:hypothetical protein